MPAKAKEKTGKKLVIVESPAKVKSIAKYLGEGFDVDASVGHIRDLPQPSELPTELKKTSVGKFAVDIDNDFEPYYMVYPDKKKRVSELKAKLKDADELYLATDADREGEAIAWHLLQVLKPKVPVRRLAFTEITKEGIERALGSMRELDTDLVDAQETRRVLDRLYGYEISPVLWRKIARGLSAGRVQSVATRLVVERERERMAFVSAGYWDVKGSFATTVGETFAAKLSSVDGKRVASGRDYDDRGQLKTTRNPVAELNQEAAESLVSNLANSDFAVTSVEDKPYTRRPAAPFTTSTLQQEASRKLRWSSKLTMQIAQRLYENGYITYMRTDSVFLSNEAVRAARTQATELYGSDSIPKSPRVYKGKSDSAQEAHEAVRPAGDMFRRPKDVRSQLSKDEFTLYELIWKRTVASQMADAKGFTATIKLAGTASDQRVAEFSASGTVITFRGFLSAYEEGKDSESDAADKPENAEARLPQLAVGQGLTGDELTALGHETTPPARYTEASIVAELEKREIGRPSTYAPTISTIMDRGYVTKRGGALVPSWIAFSVIRLLEEHFAKYVDYDFTARLEDDLDEIAQGNRARSDWLNMFYFGGKGETSPEGLKHVVDNLGDIDARAINSIKITDDITLRVGKFGPYLERAIPEGAEEGTDPQRANVPEELAPDELTAAKAEELFATAQVSERELGIEEATGRKIVAKDGRYGAYVTEIIPELTEEEIAAQPVEYYKNGKPKPPKKPVKVKPRTASLFKTMTVETVTLDEALQLMSLPRVLGADAEGEEITVQNGRFGPYLKKGSDSRSIDSEEQIFTITLDEALAIYAQPKQRGRRAAVPPLAEFGVDPTSEKNIVVKDGRFGPYITDGVTNITVPRTTSLEELTREQAIELLADKRARGPVKRTAAKKAPAKKPAAKKAPAKKATTAKKTTAKKSEK
ncbi:DNA topoisomerase I [Arthrobacter sp. MYb211]|uniref:type I DNA topoisomerase n=1 Tax=Micrococcaceae TaxID=1268 RepID=UPI000BB82E30|nr:MULTISPECIES: type I DNA topoisomerase [Micrococcaceae]PCC30121.1 DNA topoisomerase I [Glutamicibacter sp. BW80]PRA11257.1 DNA topoisomerase I [Arthrobacter sp. MYb221]PRC07570.1 DNA topoisomerase I [Arthrobacter sp. MYb211]